MSDESKKQKKDSVETKYGMLGKDEIKEIIAHHENKNGDHEFYKIKWKDDKLLPTWYDVTLILRASESDIIDYCHITSYRLKILFK